MTAKKKKSVVEEIVERSGNSFHSRVVKLLRDEKWTVLVSPHYSDNFTDKPREIDIIAEKKFDAKAIFDEYLGSINVRLFVECKYVNGETVFWFDAKDKQRAIERIMKDTGMEHPRQDPNIQNHHYFADVSVAKLFASEKSRSEDNEVISKAINQNLNATVYYRNKSDLIAPKTHYKETVMKQVAYPLIVVNSLEHFHRTEMGGDGVTTPITEPFQLEVNYAYTDKERNGVNEYFLIDVVSIDTLTAFLASLEKTDVVAIQEKVRWDDHARRNQERQRGMGNNSAR